MLAFLQNLQTGGFRAGVFQVHDLVDDGVVHGWGLGQQGGNDRHRDGHWVWLTKRRHHWHHCIRDPGYQEACTDQHCHLGEDTKQCITDLALTLFLYKQYWNVFFPLLPLSSSLALFCSFSFPHLPSNISPTFVSFISRLWLFLMRASKCEISFAEDLTLKMIMT